ncbi:MAG: right-handed parallel beta-helix repeat-containing protein [Candidatus Bathyarchaeota archaeon]|nr:right-handed parallel beta-helix repeat-containing protein [Candidatus Bathyarchaeota archaeon]
MQKKQRMFMFTLVSLMLLTTATLFSGLQSAAGSTTIYILTDGTVTPPDESIQRSGNVYVLVGNVSAEIVVEKNNIILDGNGYFLGGSGDGTGVCLCGRENVTVKNLQICDFAFGIFLGGLGCYSSYNSIVNNNITRCTSDGLYFDYYSNYNNVTGNVVAENNNGIYLYCSSSNSILRNNVIANNYEGISLSYSSNGNSITENNVAGSWFGVSLEHVADNRFYLNNFVENTYQTHISACQGNAWDNGFRGNYWSGYSGSDANSDGVGDQPYIIDAANTDRYPLTSKTSSYPAYLPQSTPNQPQQSPAATATAAPPDPTEQTSKATQEPGKPTPKQSPSSTPPVSAEPTEASPQESTINEILPWLLCSVALGVSGLLVWGAWNLSTKHRVHR